MKIYHGAPCSPLTRLLAAAGLLVFGLSQAAVVSAGEASIERRQSAAAVVWQARLPGAITHLEAWGDGELALRLETDPEQPAELWRLATAEQGSLIKITSLPADSTGLRPAASGTTSSAELLTGDLAQLWSIHRDGRVQPLLAEHRGSLAGWVASQAGWSALAEVGRLSIFHRDQRSAVAEVRLPVAVERHRYGLGLSSPTVISLWPSGATGPLFLADPHPEGKRRLRTVWVDAGSEPPTSHETWSRFPTAERLDQAEYLLVDGQPMLFAVTLDGEKVRIFGKKRLFVFPLSVDRTRAGSRPRFELITASRLWQDLDISLAELDGDSYQDLVLIQPEGFAGSKLIVEAYRGRGGGRFDSRPRRSVVDFNGKWSYGQDLDGDGEADLAMLASELVVFSGVARQQSKTVISKKANWRLPFDVEQEQDSGTAVEISVGGGDSAVEAHNDTDQQQLRVLDLWPGRGPAAIIVTKQSQEYTDLWLVRLAAGD